MHIVITKNKTTGFEYVYLKESYTDPETGKTSKRTVKNFGRKDILQRDYPGKFEELMELYQPRARRAYAAQALSVSGDSEIDSSLPNEVVHERRGTSLNYGYLLLRWVWNQVLHLEQPFTYLNNVKYHYTDEAKGKECSVFSLNSIASMLACSKAMGEASLRDKASHSTCFLGMPKDPLPKKQLNTFLGYLEDNKDYIIKSLNTQLTKRFGNERYSLLCLNASTTLFDAPTLNTAQSKDDLHTAYEDLIIELIEDGISKGVLPLSCITDDGLPNYDELPESFMNSVDENCLKHLKRRRVITKQQAESEESNITLPQQSIVLVLDSHGIPVDYALCPSTQADTASVEGALEKLKQKYQVENAVVLADSLMSSSSNHEPLLSNGMCSVVPLKLSDLSDEALNQITSLVGYEELPTIDGHTRWYKVIENYELTSVDGKIETCTLLVTFDEKRQSRDNDIINLQLKILHKKLKNKATVTGKTASWKALAKLASDGDATTVIDLDAEAFAKRASLAGYSVCALKAPLSTVASAAAAATAASAVAGERTAEPLNAEQVAKFLSRLEEVERSFSILKNNLGIRPVFARNVEHLSGQVMLCFLALTLLCTMQKILHDAGHMLSLEQLIKVLNSMEVMRVNDDKDGQSQEPMYLVLNSNDHSTYRFIDLKTHKVSSVELAHAQYNILRVLNMAIPPKAVSKTALAGALKTQFRAPKGVATYM